MKEHSGTQGTLWIDNETLADVLKSQAAFRDLSGAIFRGTVAFCGLGESIEPPATSQYHH